MHELERRVAIHEAGHAVMAYLRQVSVHAIGLDLENEQHRGYVDSEGIDQSIQDEALRRENLYSHLLINLAGGHAEKLFFGYLQGGFGEDAPRAIAIDTQLTHMDGKGRESEGRYIDQAHEDTDRMLEPHRATLAEIADRLRENKVIGHDEFLAIMKKHVYE